MNSYFVFTDEAGAYKGNDATDKFRHAHPFYIRSNILMTVDEYRLFQKDMKILNAMYEIPIDEEIKWDDLWELHQGRPRTEAIKRMSEDMKTAQMMNTSSINKASRNAFMVQYIRRKVFHAVNPPFPHRLRIGNNIE